MMTDQQATMRSDGPVCSAPARYLTRQPFREATVPTKPYHGKRTSRALSSPSIFHPRMSLKMDEAHARIDQLEAENHALRAELMTARSQLEHVLATLRQTYESVRAEQSRAAASKRG